MFEGQVAFYLQKYLGTYLNGLDAESLRISVWKGDVELKNLSLKPEALQDLDLPISVKAGLLGKLTLKVNGLSGARAWAPMTVTPRRAPGGSLVLGWQGTHPAQGHGAVASARGAPARPRPHPPRSLAPPLVPSPLPPRRCHGPSWGASR
jgi:hypothetical protein